MRVAKYGKRKTSIASRLAKVIIIIGVLALLTPYALRYLYYQTSVVLALEKEDQLGTLSRNYEQVDYARMKIAAPCVYTPEQIEAAQHDPSILDDFPWLGEDLEQIDTTGTTSASAQTLNIKEGSYLLEIPTINVKICAIRCESFKRIYKCMRSGAAIFPDAPEPDEIGNICMSAHRTGSKDYFRNLNQLSTGDTIYLHYAKNLSYQYQVVNVSIIEPDDWSVTGQTLYPALTLLSCQEYQGVSNGRRIMVRAKLVGLSK